MNYVDKTELTAEFESYFETEKISEKLHMQLYLIAENVITRHRTMINSAEDREDLISDCYTHLLKKVKKVDATNPNIFSYLTYITTNFYIDVYRARKRDYDNREAYVQKLIEDEKRK